MQTAGGFGKRHAPGHSRRGHPRGNNTTHLSGGKGGPTLRHGSKQSLHAAWRGPENMEHTLSHSVLQDEVDSVESIISWISSSLPPVVSHSSVSPSVPSSVVFVMSSVSIVAISAPARVGFVGALVGSLVGEEVGSDVSVTF